MDDFARIERELNYHSERLAAIELWKADQNTSSAVRGERDKHIDDRFDRVENSINEIKGYLLRIVWVIILGVLGAFITFLLRGGLSIGS